MSARQRKHLTITNLRGRDGSTTAPSAIPDGKVLEALNVDFYRTSFARKRGGAAAFSLSGSGLNGVIAAAFRHVPGADDTAAELWLIDAAGTVARYAGGAWSNPTLKDAITGNPHDVTAASFNGKLYLAYKSAVNRLHVWDPTSDSVRRTGLGTPAAPTAADTGAGSLAATARYYKVIYTEQRGGSTYRRSLASDTLTFTPSGTGSAVRVTKPAAITEGETHWELYLGAASDGPFYLIATTVVGTTTYDDSSSLSDLSGGNLMPTQGDNTNWTSVRYLITDDNRLLGAGAFDSGNPNNTVYASPVLGTTSSVFFDDERVPTSTANKVEFDEKDSGFITGFGGPIENNIVVFKNRQTWRLIPTGNATTPYRRKPISKVVGSIRQQGVVMAEDEAGNPTLYWLSQFGPYRLSPHGMARLVWDIKDIWDTVNLGATTVPGHGVFHGDIHQIWWWLAVSAENEPTTTKVVFDTRLGRVVDAGAVRDGWSKHSGESAKARCSVMFSNTIAATVSRDLKPYIGQHGASNRFWKCDTTDNDDAGTAFQAYVTVPDRHFGEVHRKCRLEQPLILGSVGSHSLSATFSGDYAAWSRTASVSMAAVTAGAAETRIVKRVEGVESADAFAVAVQIGDASAVAARWTVDAVVVPYESREAA